MKSFEWALIQYDWYHNKKGEFQYSDRHNQREDMKAQKEKKAM